MAYQPLGTHHGLSHEVLRAPSSSALVKKYVTKRVQKVTENHMALVLRECEDIILTGMTQNGSRAISDLHLCKGEQTLDPRETSYFIVPLILKCSFFAHLGRRRLFCVVFFSPHSCLICELSILILSPPKPK